jgi:hypothetical protein
MLQCVNFHTVIDYTQLTKREVAMHWIVWEIDFNDKNRERSVSFTKGWLSIRLFQVKSQPTPGWAVKSGCLYKFFQGVLRECLP